MIEHGLQRRFMSARDAERGMGLEVGRVIAVNNAQRRVDVALASSAVLRNVPVLSPFAGTHVGTPFIGTVDNPPGTAKTGSGPYADMMPSKTNDTFCVVGYIGGDLRRPYVMGFLFPEQFETSFADVEVQKKHNGMVIAYTEDAFEFRRPDGTYIRIGTGIEKEDLSGNFDSESVPFDDTSGDATGAPDVIVKHSSGTSIRITTAGSIIITKTNGTSFALELHTHTETGTTTSAPIAV